MSTRPEPMPDLDWGADRARRFGRRMVDLWADWLEALPGLPVDRAEGHEAVRNAVALEIPDAPMDEDRLFDHLRSLAFEHSMYPGHPDFMAYISGAGTVPGAPADLLAAGLNQNLGGWRLSPGASEIEVWLARWFARQFGLPEEAGGVLTSGGAMANLAALKVARDGAREKVRQRGVLADEPALVGYASTEVHSVSENAFDILGLGSDSLRLIPTDDGLRIRVDLLEEAIEEDLASGCQPFVVIGTAGTVGTGAIDPLPELAAACRARGLWFHVDAAYGGPAVLAEDLAPKFAGIELADSIAFDPHKWLYTPHSGGCVLVCEMQRLEDSFSVHGSYIYQDPERTDRGFDLANFGPQFSRGFQGLKIWVSLLAHGRAAFARRISHDAALARYLGERVEERDDFELMSPVELSICCFRYVPPGLDEGPERDPYLDRLNERLMTEIQADGRTYLSNAVLGDRFVLRACIVNFRTEADHIDRLLDVAAELGRALDQELRTG